MTKNCIVTRFNHITRALLGAVGGALLLGACALEPPVQEMSDARQAISAAREADAELYAPNRLQSAEEALERASHYLDDGDYLQARDAALAAKEVAMQARDRALTESNAKPR